MFRDLVEGEVLQNGDQGWTWKDPDCIELGWVDVERNNFGEIFNPEKMVRIRRPLYKHQLKLES